MRRAITPQTKEPARVFSGRQRRRPLFEPRQFVAPNQRPGVSREVVERSDLLGAYLQRRRIAPAWTEVPRSATGIVQRCGFTGGQCIQRTIGIQRTIDDDLQALEEVYQETHDPLLKRVLHEARLLSDVEFTSVNDPEEGHAERQNQGSTLAHLINLDPRITDPETRQSLILHELIHVSADRKYNVNKTGEPEPALTAVVNPNASEQERLSEIGKQARYREKLATHLASVVKGDFVVEEKAATLVLERVPRIQGASHREFDSVITELYYRLKKMGVDERTDTFKEVAAMTAAAYRSRHQSLPLDQTYKEPIKTGFLS